MLRCSMFENAPLRCKWGMRVCVLLLLTVGGWVVDVSNVSNVSNVSYVSYVSCTSCISYISFVSDGISLLFFRCCSFVVVVRMFRMFRMFRIFRIYHLFLMVFRCCGSFVVVVPSLLWFFRCCGSFGVAGTEPRTCSVAPVVERARQRN